jgi:hypothetical protein
VIAVTFHYNMPITYSYLNFFQDISEHSQSPLRKFDKNINTISEKYDSSTLLDITWGKILLQTFSLKYGFS